MIRNSVEERLSTPVLGEYEVIVCGGGVAGISAAVSARRAGAKRVLLIEKEVVFGGLSTLGLISLYEPLCDGRGNKMVYGMAGELMKLCRKYGPDDLPPAWENDPDNIDGEERYKCYFSPAMFALALDEFVLDAGVEVLLDSKIVLPLMEGKRCTGVFVENKTGRSLYKAGAFVDATGDAELLCRAGVPCVAGENYLTYVVHRADVDAAKRACESGNMLALHNWFNAGGGVKGEGHPVGMKLFTGLTSEQVTDYVLKGRRLLMETVRSEPRLARDIIALPLMPQLRMIRRIDGAFTLRPEHINRRFEDSISTIVDFLEADKCYEMPFGMLYHPAFDNLYTAGRTVSASGWAWDVARTIPGAAVTGQAAGVAAAMSAQRGIRPADVNVKELQAFLVASGMRLHVDQRPD